MMKYSDSYGSQILNEYNIYESSYICHLQGKYTPHIVKNKNRITYIMRSKYNFAVFYRNLIFLISFNL